MNVPKEIVRNEERWNQMGEPSSREATSSRTPMHATSSRSPMRPTPSKYFQSILERHDEKQITKTLASSLKKCYICYLFNKMFLKQFSQLSFFFARQAKHTHTHHDFYYIY